jgi:catechol 2,3-dioxygenase-like lactoylglutathione lyase family enzyme
MIDHVSVQVRDLQTSAAFYDAVLAPLRMTRLAEAEGTVGYGRKYPEFWINARTGAAPAGAGSGAHVALRARTPEAVGAFHAAALASGGRCDGAPGPRPEYDARYYAAFVLDPDGNRVEAVTFLESS